MCDSKLRDAHRSGRRGSLTMRTSPTADEPGNMPDRFKVVGVPIVLRSTCRVIFTMGVMERETGLEPATWSLEGSRSTS